MSEKIKLERPTFSAFRVRSRDFRGPNWLDQRRASGEYADRDPAVLVVNEGQGRAFDRRAVTRLQVDTLIVDRWPRIGDNWRRRHHRERGKTLTAGFRSRCTGLKVALCFRRERRLRLSLTMAESGEWQQSYNRRGGNFEGWVLACDPRRAGWVADILRIVHSRSFF